MIGGGDTGADCVGNALREGAASVTQLELLAEPPAHAPRRPHAVAAVAAEVPHLVRDQGGRRAGLLDHDDAASPASNGRVRADPLGAGRAAAAVRAVEGTEASRPPSSCCWRWASCIPSSALLDAARRRARPARQRRAAPATRPRVDGRLRRRRRPPRPVADRLGDQRGPPVRRAWSTATWMRHRRPARTGTARAPDPAARGVASGRRPAHGGAFHQKPSSRRSRNVAAQLAPARQRRGHRAARDHDRRRPAATPRSASNGRSSTTRARSPGPPRRPRSPRRTATSTTRSTPSSPSGRERKGNFNFESDRRLR